MLSNKSDKYIRLNFIFFLQMLKQKAALNETERQQVENLLFIIFEKTKYDEGFYFDRDGEEEAIFLEYRYEILHSSR